MVDSSGRAAKKETCVGGSGIGSEADAGRDSNDADADAGTVSEIGKAVWKRCFGDS